MGVERIPSDSNAVNLPSVQPDAVHSFNLPPFPSEDSARKSRKRKRNRRKHRGDDNASPTTANQDSSKDKPKIAASGDEGTVWSRDSSPAASKLGEKAFSASREEEEKTDKPDAESMDDVKASINEAGETDEVGEASEPVPDTAELGEPSQEEPIERLPEPPLPQMPPVPRLNPFEQSYEVPPAMPPDPLNYRRRFWDEQPSFEEARQRDSLPPLHDYEQQAYMAAEAEPVHTPYYAPPAEAPAAVPSQSRYESPTPPGLQRTPADVSRAAWTGVLAGWWWGRRGKRQAVEQARQAGVQEGVASVQTEQYIPPRLEAEPMHQYQPHEQAESRLAVQPLSVETHVSSPMPERPMVASVAVITFERAINRERREVPRPAKVIAKAATERLVARPPETVSSNRQEQQLSSRELLQIAKDIKIDNVRLKDVYDARRIDEAGLRSVVETYLRGGDIKQRLTREIVTKEQTYERDPQLRHQRQAGEQERRSSTSSKPHKVSQALSYAGGAAANQSAKAAASTQKTLQSLGQKVVSGAKQAQRDLIDNSNTTDWLSITAVVVLYSIILILLLG